MSVVWSVTQVIQSWSFVAISWVNVCVYLCIYNICVCSLFAIGFVCPTDKPRAKDEQATPKLDGVFGTTQLQAASEVERLYELLIQLRNIVQMSHKQRAHEQRCLVIPNRVDESVLFAPHSNVNAPRLVHQPVEKTWR